MNQKVIFLIHGFGSNNRVWDAYKEFFVKNRFRVVAPNLRHHAPDENLDGFEKVSLLDYLDDLEIIIKKLESRPIIIGYSMGGLLALKLMERGYGKLGICLAPAAPRGISALSFSVLRIFLRNLLTWQFWKKIHYPRFSTVRFGALAHLPLEEAKELFDLICSPESGRVGAEIGFPIFDSRKASFFDEKKITCPVLVIGAGMDKVTQKIIHVSDYVEYPKFGHWLMSGKEFDTVSVTCMEWIEDKLDKL